MGLLINETAILYIAFNYRLLYNLVSTPFAAICMGLEHRINMSYYVSIESRQRFARQNCVRRGKARRS